MPQNVSEEHVRKIVEEVVQRVVSGGDGSEGGDTGVFATIDAAVQSATRAQQQLVALSLEERKKIVEALRQTAHIHAEEFSRRALAETGMGRLEDKIIKHQVAADTTPGVEDHRGHFVDRRSRADRR